MTTYKVTTELKTKWWWTILRFFRLKSKREEFEIVFDKDFFSKGEILSYGIVGSIKIIGRKKDKPKTNIFCGWFQVINQTNHY